MARGRRQLTAEGLADLNIGNTTIVAEDQAQSVLVDVVRKITNVDGVRDDLREDGVVGRDSRLALLQLCKREGKSLVVAKSLVQRVSKIAWDASKKLERFTLRASWHGWNNSKRKKAPAGRLYRALSVWHGVHQ